MRLLATLSLLFFLLQACDDTTTPSGAPDAADVIATPEVGDAGGDASPDAGVPEPKPVAEPEERAPLPVSRWMVALSNEGAPDLVAAIDAGAVEVPEPGSAYGLFWTEVTPGDNGRIALSGLGSAYYAIGEVVVDTDTRIVARADGVSVLSAGRQRQPGDVYHSGRHRVPLHLEAGANVIVARGSRRNHDPEVALEVTDHDLVFNPADVTSPHLVEGATTPQHLGLPVLNLTGAPLTGITASVVESDHLEPTERRLDGLPAASSQVSFELRPKPGLVHSEEPLAVRLHVEAAALDLAYEIEVEVPTAPDGPGVIRRTRLSAVDRSTQYHAINRPTGDHADYGLVLSLHGASVEATGQANAYGSKDDLVIVAPTNRRPYGFDWESFGRLDALEALEHAQAELSIDPTRVYLSGHSMGGHGTWQLGTLFPGRFAVIGPSAGWISFDTYAGGSLPGGLFGWAALSSDTLRYIENLQQRAVYIIHGDADDNVPVGQARTMRDALTPLVDDLHYHEEPGAGHWWDGDLATGADCVDWPPLFDLVAGRTLDTAELSFTFVTPSPAVSPRHSFVTVRSAITPSEPARVVSTADGASISVSTENVRGLVLDGAALVAAGVTEVTVDGASVPVEPEDLPIGPQDGKHPDAYGPLVQVFQRPFCLVYPDVAPIDYRHYASYLASTWNVIGNGASCVLTGSQLTDDVRAAHNIVYLGFPADEVPIPAEMALDWDEVSIRAGDQSIEAAALAVVFPEGDRLSAALVTTRTHEELLYRLQPFSSRFWIPDWIVFTDDGAAAAGFFGPDWRHSAELSTP